MPARRTVLSFIVDLKDKATKGLQRINKDGLRSLKTGVTAVTRVLKIGAVALTGYVTATALLAKRGGEVLEVQRAFNRQVGGKGVSALNSLKAASEGLISNYEIMVGLNRALTLGAVENADEFEDLTKTALALGRALGVDAAFAMESLSLGIGRQSKLILDNLGLIISVEDANARYAVAIGKTTSALTENEKKIAFRNAAMDAAKEKVSALGEIELNAGDAVTRFTVAIANARDELGKLVAQSPLVREFFQSMTGVVDGVTAIIIAGTPTMRAAGEEAGTVIGNAMSEAVIRAWVATIDKFQQVVLFPITKILELFNVGIDVEKFFQEINPLREFLLGTADLAASNIEKALARLQGLAKRNLQEIIDELLSREGGAREGIDVGPLASGIFPFDFDMIGRIESEALPTLAGLASIWTQIGSNMSIAQGQTITLAETMAGVLTDSVTRFGAVFMSVFQRLPATVKTLGKAFAGAMLGALASVAAGFAKFYAAQAAAALALGLTGDPRGFAAAAKYSLASAGMGALAGILGRQVSTVTGGGGATGIGGLNDFREDLTGAARGRGVIIIEGDPYLDMTNPRIRDRLAEALSEIGANRDVEIIFRGG